MLKEWTACDLSANLHEKNNPCQSTGHFTAPSSVAERENGRNEKKKGRGEKSKTVRSRPNKCQGTAAVDSAASETYCTQVAE